MCETRQGETANERERDVGDGAGRQRETAIETERDE